MRQKHCSLISSLKSFFGQGHCFKRKLPKIRRKIKLHFEVQSIPVIAANPLRLLEMLTGFLLVLTRKRQIHFASEPELTGGPMHILDAVNDLPGFSIGERNRFLDRHHIFLIARPDGAQTRETHLRMGIFHHIGLVTRFNEIPLLAILTAIEIVDLRVEMKKMVQQACAAVPVGEKPFFQARLFDAHAVMNGFYLSGIGSPMVRHKFQQLFVVRLRTPETWRRVRDHGELVVSMDPANLPYSGTRTIVPDSMWSCAADIADRLHVKLRLEWLDIHRETAVGELIQGRCDLVLGEAVAANTVADDEPLAGKILYSRPYYGTGYVLVRPRMDRMPARWPS